MAAKSKIVCETCGDETESYVHFQCTNPRCPRPEHDVCMSCWQYINGQMSKVLASGIKLDS